MSEKAILTWLKQRPAYLRMNKLEQQEREDTLQGVARSISRWQTKDQSQQPSLNAILILETLLGDSLELLLGRPNPIDTISVQRQWLRDYLRQCDRLACYVLFATIKDVTSWASAGRSLQHRTEALEASTAEGWTKKTTLFGVSERLRREHGITSHDDVSTMSMFDIMNARLGWIESSGRYGSLLRWYAHREFFRGVFRAICNQSDPGTFERFPCVDRDTGVGSRSLRIAFDRLPKSDSEFGWIIYYFWEPKMSKEDLETLVVKARKQKDRDEESLDLTQRKHFSGV